MSALDTKRVKLQIYVNYQITFFNKITKAVKSRIFCQLQINIGRGVIAETLTPRVLLNIPTWRNISPLATRCNKLDVAIGSASMITGN